MACAPAAPQPGPMGAAQPEPDAALLAFCRALPKAELHAHLNGCTRPATLAELARASGAAPSDAELLDLQFKPRRDLPSAFRMFEVIRGATTSHAALRRVAREAVEDFALDGCVLLELRTTPKDMPERGVTKRSYVDAVLAGICDAHAITAATAAGQPLRTSQQARAGDIWSSFSSGGGGGCRGTGDGGMLVRLILSVDRRESTEAALETVALADELRAAGAPVVGVDLCGNPAVGQWATWLPAFERAKAAGLRVTLHAGEVVAYEETAAMIAFAPDRLGHCCCLNADLERHLWASRIPVELCLTSNVVSESVPNVEGHHFRSFAAAGHPVALCTDDSGVFATTLSREYALAATAFGLDEAALVQLATAAVRAAFVTDSEREALLARLEAFVRAGPGGS